MGLTGFRVYEVQGRWGLGSTGFRVSRVTTDTPTQSLSWVSRFRVQGSGFRSYTLYPTKPWHHPLLSPQAMSRNLEVTHTAITPLVVPLVAL